MINNRKELFETFLKDNEYYIDYSGILYTMVDKKNNVIIQTETTEEIATFIIGWNKGKETSKEEIETLMRNNEELRKQNITNIERYEQIICNSGNTDSEDEVIDTLDCNLDIA